MNILTSNYISGKLAIADRMFHVENSAIKMSSDDYHALLDLDYSLKGSPCSCVIAERSGWMVMCQASICVGLGQHLSIRPIPPIHIIENGSELTLPTNGADTIKIDIIVN